MNRPRCSGDTVAALIGVGKRLSGSDVLSDVTVLLPRGTAVGLLGPNGAGKTTLVSLITGVRRPDSGRVELFGGSPRDWRTRRRMGVVPQEIGFPPTLMVGEVIDLVRSHFDAPAGRAELLVRFALDDLAGRGVGRISSGQRRRLAIALAFAGRPDLLVLDEPTVGLDVQARRVVWQELRQYVLRGGSILLTTHYLEEMEALADRVVLLHQGRVLVTGTAAEVKASVEHSRAVLSAGTAGVRPLTLEDAVLRLIEEAR